MNHSTVQTDTNTCGQCRYFVTAKIHYKVSDGKRFIMPSYCTLLASADLNCLRDAFSVSCPFYVEIIPF